MSTPEQPIQACLFDVGGVLVVPDTFTEAAAQVALGVDDLTMKKIWSESIPALGSGWVDEAAFWQGISTSYGTRVVDPKEKVLGKAFAAGCKRYEQMFHFALTLRDRDIITGIVSDTIEPQASVHRERGDYDGFCPLVLSYQVHSRKPALPIYKIALDRLRLPPEAVAFVDDRNVNVGAARELGLHAVKFNTPDQAIRDLSRLIFGNS